MLRVVLEDEEEEEEESTQLLNDAGQYSLLGQSASRNRDDIAIGVDKAMPRRVETAARKGGEHDPEREEQARTSGLPSETTPRRCSYFGA